jgi:acetyl esterase/lipase
VVGYSTGGYLALMIGLTETSDGLDGNDKYSQFSSNVQAVVNIAGTLDMTGPNDEEFFLVSYFGGKRSEMPEVYERAKPLNYIKRDNPPILTIQGDLDDLLSQSRTFDAKCRSVGARHMLVVLKGKDHSAGLVMWDDPQVWSFLKKSLGQKSILNLVGIYP